jgi:hypothetical protein
MAHRHLETSLHRLVQSRLLRRAEDIFWFLREFSYLKQLKRLHESHFSIPEMQKIITHGPSTPWNIVSSTSSKSSLKTCRRQILSSQGHSPIENITSSTSWKSLFRFPRCRKWVRLALRHLETSLHRLRQSRLLRRSEGRLWVLKAIRVFKTTLNRLRPSRSIRFQG